MTDLIARPRVAHPNPDLLDEDPWTDPVTNPYGCCQTHRPGGPGTRQVHGDVDCWWPSGPKVGDRVVLRTDRHDPTAARGTVTDVTTAAEALHVGRPELVVTWDQHGRPEHRAGSDRFAKVT